MQIEEEILKNEKPEWQIIKNDFKVDDMKETIIYAFKNPEMYSDFNLIRRIDSDKFLISDVWVEENGLIYTEGRESPDEKIRYCILEIVHEFNQSILELYELMLFCYDIYNELPCEYENSICHFMNFMSKKEIEDLNSEELCEIFDTKKNYSKVSYEITV